MEQIEMVRCFLSSDPGEPGTVRYVPLEIYELWRFLMERVHHLAVNEPVVSQWRPEQGADTAPDGAEPVIEVSFKYMDCQHCGRPVTRYLPEANFEQISSYLLSHFPEKHLMEGMTRRKGFFLAADAVPYSV